MSILNLDELPSAGQARTRPGATAPAGAEAPDAVVLPGWGFDLQQLMTRGIRRRRGVPLMGYVGLNGHGKSFSMVRDTLPSLAVGRPVLSTVALLDPHTGNPHPLYIPFRRWAQIEGFRDGDMLLDEVTGIMDSRDSGMPKKVRRLLPQMRRRNVVVRWTGVDWDNSDRRLRQITQAVTKCTGHLPNYKLHRQTGSEDAVALWAPNRLFLLTTYDASTMTQTEDGQQLTQDDDRRRKAKVKCRELVYGPRALAFKCYNTLDAVDAIDNSCPMCGGRVPDKVCKHSDEDRAAALSALASGGL